MTTKETRDLIRVMLKETDMTSKELYDTGRFPVPFSNLNTRFKEMPDVVKKPLPGCPDWGPYERRQGFVVYTMRKT